MARTAILAAGTAGLALPAWATVLSQSTPAAGVAVTKMIRTGPEVMPPALRPVFYRSLAKDAGVAYNVNRKGCATLPRTSFEACFNHSGAHFTGGGSPLSLHLVAYGRSRALGSVGPTPPTIKGNHVSYAYGNLSEWWRILPSGFEQGFTIIKRPSGQGKLTLALAANAKATRLDGALDWGKLRYGQLVVTDANGKVVPATLKSRGNRVLIAVNDAHAAYPLTVDPLVWLEQEVTASNGTQDDSFGGTLALSGTTALVGAASANNSQGAVYVFTESNGVWAQTQELSASDGAPDEDFGDSVAVAGTTALIGAPGVALDQSGSVYVFTESDGTWTQRQELTASGGLSQSYFGYSVALAGTTALIGAPGTGNYQGATYVFSESGGTWSQTQELAASDGAPGDWFGWSVAVDGTSALIGVPLKNLSQGVTYVFGESNGTWTQTQELTASDGAYDNQFGRSVALAGTTALIGAPYATVNGNSEQGAAYVFTNSNGTWSQAQKLTASDGAVEAIFGFALSLSGNTALIGAYCHYYDPSSGECSPGVAYVFDESGGTWSQTQELSASNGATDNEFGYAVALDGTTALSGAFGANGYVGAAYLYSESDLGLNISAPQTVNQGQQYVSQTIATNNASVASPAVTATVTVPAAASFISAAATQGNCSEASGVVTCDFGQINGNAGTASANVTLKAIGNVGTTIENTASVAKATPSLMANAPTQITASSSCPQGYSEFDGSIAAHKLVQITSYAAGAGQENAILTGPAGIQLGVRTGGKIYGIPGNEIHRNAPAGTYTWGAKAGSSAGNYMFCSKHP
ncbi:MAG: hypothetical protein ACRES7_09150 [Gammaproteobacteria bacterium]